MFEPAASCSSSIPDQFTIAQAEKSFDWGKVTVLAVGKGGMTRIIGALVGHDDASTSKA